MAADAERRRGYGHGSHIGEPYRVHIPGAHIPIGGGGMGTPSGLSLLRDRDVPMSSPAPPVSGAPRDGSIFTVENLTAGGGMRNSHKEFIPPRSSPASYTSAAATRAFIAARDWADPVAVDPRAPHYRFLEDEEAAAPAPFGGVSPEFGSSSALDNLAPPLGTCSDGLHCHPPSTAGMGMPITPALLEPRGGLLGGAAETEPPTWRRGAGSRLDFDGVAGTIAPSSGPPSSGTRTARTT